MIFDLTTLICSSFLLYLLEEILTGG